MAKRLRYGMIGTGTMGIEHIKNIARVEGAERVAFADPHQESRRWARLVAGGGPRRLVDFANGVRALLDLCTRNHEEVAATGDRGKQSRPITVEARA